MTNTINQFFAQKMTPEVIEAQRTLIEQDSVDFLNHTVTMLGHIFGVQYVADAGINNLEVNYDGYIANDPVLRVVSDVFFVLNQPFRLRVDATNDYAPDQVIIDVEWLKRDNTTSDGFTSFSIDFYDISESEVDPIRQVQNQEKLENLIAEYVAYISLKLDKENQRFLEGSIS